MQLVLEKDEILTMVAEAMESGKAMVKIPEGMVIYGGKLTTGSGNVYAKFDLLTPEQAETRREEESASAEGE